MSSTSDKTPHRGRIQVQGQDMKEELSRPWAQDTPPLAESARQNLADLQASCDNGVRELRDQAFRKARRYIDDAEHAGGAAAPVRRTFQNRNLPPRNDDARVDIEVLSGLAFT